MKTTNENIKPQKSVYDYYRDIFMDEDYNWAPTSKITFFVVFGDYYHAVYTDSFEQALKEATALFEAVDLFWEDTIDFYNRFKNEPKVLKYTLHKVQDIYKQILLVTKDYKEVEGKVAL